MSFVPLTRRPAQHLVTLLIALGLHLHSPAQTHTPTQAEAAPPSATDRTANVAVDAPQPLALAWGVGLFQYREPGWMRLTGPEATLQAQYRPTSASTSWWPERLQADLGVALLDYTSDTTGRLHHRAGLNGRGTALWGIHASDSGTWLAGAQIDLAWTDLRGTSSSGHRGYRRLGSKAWVVLRHETAAGAHAEVGALLRGRQDSLLSDLGGRDVTNSQRRGHYLLYQHTPLEGPGLRPRPWARYSEIGRSDNDGIYYEPRNRTLQLGVLFDWP